MSKTFLIIVNFVNIFHFKNLSFRNFKDLTNNFIIKT